MGIVNSFDTCYSNSAIRVRNVRFQLLIRQYEQLTVIPCVFVIIDCVESSVASNCTQSCIDFITLTQTELNSYFLSKPIRLASKGVPDSQSENRRVPP